MLIYRKNLTKEELLKRNIVIDKSAIVAEGVKLECNVCVLGTSVVGKDCVVGANSVLENCELDEGVKVLSSFISSSRVGKFSTVGPFAHLRNGCEIGANCRIGNFVEIKNSKLGEKCKVAHLTYIGDAELNENCNVGCGVVFCNYNGCVKQKVKVGKNVFIGSNVNLIAPLVVEDNAYIAAGSTINKNIHENDFAIARARQENKKGFVNPYLRK